MIKNRFGHVFLAIIVTLCGNLPASAQVLSKAGFESGPTTLPIEVFGSSGATARVVLDVDSPEEITHLYLRCYACGYRDHRLDSDPAITKAGVRINGGALTALKHYTGSDSGPVDPIGNTEIVLLGPAVRYGGIGGSFHTIDLVVPVSGLRAGANAIDFVHVDARPPSMGFRIVKLDLLTSPDPTDSVLLPSDIVMDDPAQWAAPLHRAEDITAGKSLWESRDFLYDPLVDELDGTGGPIDGFITASCADCHAANGRDLKYFNFSNRSIIERARFHGLSASDGALIASYIRTRPQDIVAGAWPWNPPYQPGPGMDARPVHEWAAGAGIDAVLVNDSDMEAHLFPAGQTDAAVSAVVDRHGKLNMRELPIALQLPDWNQWLPAVHPLDAFDTSAQAVRLDHRGNPTSQPDRPFFELLYERVAANPTSANMGEFFDHLIAWVGRGGTCYTQSVTGGPGWRAADSLVLQNLALALPGVDPDDCEGTRHTLELGLGSELAKQGLNAWMSVKLWEINHGNALEEAGASMTTPVCTGRPTPDQCVDASEARGWVLNGGKAVFTHAPHYVGFNSRHFTYQTLLGGTYESTAWYHLQLILDTGNRSFAPSHFIYTMSWIDNLDQRSGQAQSFRYWATKIKMRQQQTNNAYGVEAGLDLRTAQPFYLWSDNRGDTRTRAGVGNERWRQIVDAMLLDLVADALNATEEEWRAANQNRQVQLPESTDFAPCPECFDTTQRPHPFNVGPLQGRNTLRVIPKLREIGVSESTLDVLIDWCEVMWPQADWESVRAP